MFAPGQVGLDRADRSRRLPFEPVCRAAQERDVELGQAQYPDIVPGIARGIAVSVGQAVDEMSRIGIGVGIENEDTA